MGTSAAILATICLATIAGYAEGGTTWLWFFTSTQSTLDWNKFLASFGTWPAMNYTTEDPWWDLTTTTLPPTTSTIPTTTEEITTPPEQPEVIKSTDTIFLIVIIASCVVGLIISGILLVFSYKLMAGKKHKKTKRLRVKPLKADQAFATPMPAGMGMMGMDPLGMGGLMPPMDTGMMGIPGAMDPFAMPTGMDPTMGPCEPNTMGVPGGEKQQFFV